MSSSENKYYRGSEWRKWDLHAHTALDKDWEENVDLSTVEAKKAFAKNILILQQNKI